MKRAAELQSRLPLKEVPSPGQLLYLHMDPFGAFSNLSQAAAATLGLDRFYLFAAKIEGRSTAAGPHRPGIAAAEVGCQRDGDDGEEGDRHEQLSEGETAIPVPSVQRLSLPRSPKKGGFYCREVYSCRLEQVLENFDR